MKQLETTNKAASTRQNEGRSGAKIGEKGTDAHRGPDIQKRLDTIASSVQSDLLRQRYSGFYLRAVDGNRKAAITSQCLECVAWQREEVRLCTDTGCPLYRLRPYKDKQSQRGAEDET